MAGKKHSGGPLFAYFTWGAGEADNELSETEPEKIPLDQKGQGDCRVTEYFLEIGDRRYELTTLLTSFED